MSIKQNGGVFGRNPTFNDVTIEGQLTFDGDIDINSDLKVDGDLEVTGDAAIGTGFTPDTQLHVYSASDQVAKFESADQIADIALKDTGGTCYIRQSNGSLTFEADRAGASSNSRIFFKVDNQLAAHFTAVGNLAFESGKGIDFSATAGTGTSELLDDYEEGTWTPYIKFAGANNVGIVYVTQTGNYTKIGNLVQISYKVQLSSKGAQTGTATIANLPFAGNGEASIMPVFFTNLSLTGEQIPIGRVAGSTTVELRTQSSGDVASMTDSNIENNSDIRMSGSYLT